MEDVEIHQEKQTASKQRQKPTHANERKQTNIRDSLQVKKYVSPLT